jgi:hypothetical protein
MQNAFQALVVSYGQNRDVIQKSVCLLMRHARYRILVRMAVSHAKFGIDMRYSETRVNMIHSWGTWTKFIFTSMRIYTRHATLTKAEEVVHVHWIAR